MKIGLVIHPYGEERPSGLGRAIFQMVKALVEVDVENHFTLYFKETPKHLPEIGGAWKTIVLNAKRLLLYAGALKRGQQDIFIFFTPVIPLTFFPKKSIVVVHDLGFLRLPKKGLKAWVVSCVLYVCYLISFHKADKIVAVSQATKDDICRYFKISAEKIEVVHNGFTPPTAQPQPISCPEHFFLFTGAVKERKNVERIIDAFILFSKTHPTFHLLLAGKAEGPYVEMLKEKAEKAGLTEQIQFLGYVSDEELAYLYSKTTTFVFPSLVEGFGLTILEAMFEGAPVITSDTGALAEVAGEAALLVDPYSIDSISKALATISGNESLRADLIGKGKERVHLFSWETFGRSLGEIISLHL